MPRRRAAAPSRIIGAQAVAEDAVRPRERVGADLDRHDRVEVVLAHRPQRRGRGRLSAASALIGVRPAQRTQRGHSARLAAALPRSARDRPARRRGFVGAPAAQQRLHQAIGRRRRDGAVRAGRVSPRQRRRFGWRHRRARVQGVACDRGTRRRDARTTRVAHGLQPFALLRRPTARSWGLAARSRRRRGARSHISRARTTRTARRSPAARAADRSRARPAPPARPRSPGTARGRCARAAALEAEIAHAADHQQAGDHRHRERGDSAARSPLKPRSSQVHTKLATSPAAAGLARPMNQRLSTWPTWRVEARQPQRRAGGVEEGDEPADLAEIGPSSFIDDSAQWYITSAGARPKLTRSASESYCTPNSLCVLVRRATRPSRPSRMPATKTAMQASSKRPWVAAMIA